MHRLIDLIVQISIHALRGEGDSKARCDMCRYQKFLSTPSVGRATQVWMMMVAGKKISIHALRGEGDFLVTCKQVYDLLFLSTPSVGRATSPSLIRILGKTYFYPRPPWGGRRNSRTYQFTVKVFLSTPSVGRATAKVHKNPVQLLRKGYNRFPAGRRNPLRSGKTTVSIFNNLAAKC